MPKIANLPRLHLRRVLSVWAENLFGSSLGQVRARTKFSAQTDNTRKTWRGLNLAILALQGSSKKILRKTKQSQKRHFWARSDFVVVLNRLFSSFWPRSCLFSANGALFEICDLWFLRSPSPGPSQQKSAKSLTHLALEQLLRKHMFSGSVFDAESIEKVKPNFWHL